MGAVSLALIVEELSLALARCERFIILRAHDWPYLLLGYLVVEGYELT
jgi:hypothetical protein